MSPFSQIYDTWVTIVIIGFLFVCFLYLTDLLSLLIINTNCNFILKLLQYCIFK